MKLIMEGASLLTGFYEDELNEASGSTERNYYISGIFSTPEAKNRNGRVYSRAIWEREVKTYQKEITERSVNTLGEWQHPPRSTVDPIKAVIRIVELKLDETGNVVGKAKILNNNTEATNSLKGLIKEGIKIGVSSRGVGKVSSTGVVEDFKLITYDAVDMPSDYNAMLDGVVEGVHFVNGIAQDREYRVDENGCVGEVCGLQNLDTPVVETTGDEMKKEKCPIQEKIDEAVNEAKEEIYANINDYLLESFDKIEADRGELIENISDFLTIESGTVLEESSKEDTIYKNDEVLAEALLRALTEKEEKVCEECGKELDEKSEETVCEACSEKDEDEEKPEDEKSKEKTNENVDSELDMMVKMKKISKKDLEKVIEFAKVCNPKTIKEDLDTAFGKKFDKNVLDRVVTKISSKE